MTTAGAAQAMIGDLNGDGRINVRDVVLIQQHVLGKIFLAAQQRAVADIDGDGRIDARDAALIMQRSIGRIVTFQLQVTRVDEVTRTVSPGTAQANIGLPATVMATLSDGTRRSLSAQWETTSTPAYNPNVSGTYVFMGNLVNLPSGTTNPQNIRARAAVTVASVPGPIPLTPLHSVSITPATPVVGGTLTAVVSPLGATAAYRWQSSPTGEVGSFSDIAGATSNTYVPVAGDVNHRLRVIATGSGSFSGTVTSAAIGPVTTTGMPLEISTLVVKTATSLEVKLTRSPVADLTHANFKVERAPAVGGVFATLTGITGASPGPNQFKVTKVAATTYRIELGAAMVTGNVLKVSPSTLTGGNVLTGPAKEVIVDLTPPVISDQETIRTATTQAIFTFTSNEAGTMYWVVVPHGDQAPSVTQVKEGKRSGGANALAAGTYSLSAGSGNRITISSGIVAVNAYRIYYVAADNQAVPNETAVLGPVAISATVVIFIPDGTYEVSAGNAGNNIIHRNNGNVITITNSAGVPTVYDTGGAATDLISKTQLLRLLNDPTSAVGAALNAKGLGNANATTGDKITFRNGIITNIEIAAPTEARTVALATNDTVPAEVTLTLRGGAGLTITRTAPLTGKITVLSGTVDLSDSNIQSAIEAAEGAATITVRNHATFGVVTSRAGISAVEVVSTGTPGDSVTITGNGATVNWTAANNVTIGGTPTNVTATLTGNDAVTIDANVSGTATIPATSGAVTVSAGKTVNRLIVNGAFSGGLAINGTITTLEVRAPVNVTTIGVNGSITNPIVFAAAGQLTVINQNDVVAAKTIDFGTTCQTATSIRAHPTQELTLKGTKAANTTTFVATITGGNVDLAQFSPHAINLAATDSTITANQGARETNVTNSANSVSVTAAFNGKVNISAGHKATINGIEVNAVTGTRVVTAVDPNKIKVVGSANPITISVSTAATDKTVEFVTAEQTGSITATGTPNAGTAKLILLADSQSTGTFSLAGGRVDISDPKSTIGGTAMATVTNVTGTSTLFPGARNVAFLNTTAIANVIAGSVGQTVTIPANRIAAVNGVIFDTGASGRLIATVGSNNKLSFSKGGVATANIRSVNVTSASTVDELYFDSSAAVKTLDQLTVDHLASLRRLDMPATGSVLNRLIVYGSLREGYVRMPDLASEHITVSTGGTLGTLTDATKFRIEKTGLANAFRVGLQVGANFSGTFVDATVAATPSPFNNLVASFTAPNSMVSGTVSNARTTITFTRETTLTLTLTSP